MKVIRLAALAIIVVAAAIIAIPQHHAHADLYFCEDCAHSVPHHAP